MPSGCENCKANPVEIARNTVGTPTAKLIAILAAHGVTGAAEIAEIVGISDRAVRKARNSGSAHEPQDRNYRTGTQVPGGTTGPELQDRSGTQVPKTELQDRNSGSAIACADITTRATNESLRDSYFLEVSIPLAPISIDEPSVDAPKAKAKRGARLDGEWELPAEWRMWARTNFPASTDAQVFDQAAQFRDYWIAKPGAQACKLDWEATWRNWCRRGLSQLAHVRQPQHTGRYHDPDSPAAMSARAIARVKAEMGVA